MIGENRELDRNGSKLESIHEKPLETSDLRMNNVEETKSCK
jgi:hypothetical protein